MSLYFLVGPPGVIWVFLAFGVRYIGMFSIYAKQIYLVLHGT